MQKKETKKDPKDMRHGYTTGACATAATKAALTALIFQETQKEATITLPIGKQVSFDMSTCEFNEDTATAGTIKDGGDDPDATHGALILSTVSWSMGSGIELDGGIGVGRVTKPGLPVEVGRAAINPVPFKMIMEVTQTILQQSEIHKGVRVEISVPEGEEIAKKTLNERLGIVGGISILGTRGTVVPFSTSAFKASIAHAINVAVTAGCDHLILATGGRSEKFGMELYPDLPEEAFIEMGDFVGFTLKTCKNKKVKKVTLVGMMGKFSKVANGVMMVHSKSAPIDFNFLAKVAAECDVDEITLENIKTANTASQVGDMMLEQNNKKFFDTLCKYCCLSSLKEVNGDMEVETIISTLKGVLLGRKTIHSK
ncbi:cobalt-precorrin-5B (C(1))-methyltransferase [Chengkuizengella marina]|uniref:Cobalt-precorrin-5B C(1)-methyltransferase n=1 Tax=Chengkuizengella marina TaxID=2507566 RepID=A0A6N9PZ80_9BACL|nr:cobalt-precorrin-5B (C(1))-methyltransferase [Chengkuizengella marina]NBI27925.1 cobalt-precorrin-5B (C(1))-methyltransferase [Chengkuizengella marina]